MQFKNIDKNGVSTIILHKGKLLIVKRINLPFLITYPGKWFFVAGKREKGEKFIDTAYREIKEEVKIRKDHLRLLHKSKLILLDHKKGQRWVDKLFVFCSSTDNIILNFEHSQYKWVNLDEFKKIFEPDIIENRKEILALIRKHVRKC